MVKPLVLINQQNELEALNDEKLKAMPNEFRVFQEYIEETQEAILDTHRQLSEREAGIRNPE